MGPFRAYTSLWPSGPLRSSALPGLLGEANHLRRRARRAIMEIRRAELIR